MLEIIIDVTGAIVGTGVLLTLMIAAWGIPTLVVYSIANRNKGDNK